MLTLHTTTTCIHASAYTGLLQYPCFTCILHIFPYAQLGQRRLHIVFVLQASGEFPIFYLCKTRLRYDRHISWEPILHTKFTQTTIIIIIVILVPEPCETEIYEDGTSFLLSVLKFC